MGKIHRVEGPSSGGVDWINRLPPAESFIRFLTRPPPVCPRSSGMSMAGIKPGLERISALVRAANPNGYPWRSIHVAGTNGKGSVCAFTSAMLGHVGVRSGTFTSPHLIHEHDCIKIDSRPISRAVFEECRSTLQEWNEMKGIGATNFELLAATAFEIFKSKEVDVAIIEAGMGGRLDATNVIDTPDCAVITKIGLDHQEFLGSTIEAIAGQKAGIIKPGGKYVVDPSNDSAALRVIYRHGADVHAKRVGSDWSPDEIDTVNTINRGLAARSIEAAFPEFDRKSSGNPLRDAYQAVTDLEIPGRQQWINLAPLTGRIERVVLDGAHNPQSAQALRRFVERIYPDQPRTWLLAASRTKDVRGMFSELVAPIDTVITTQFGPVEGMPWVISMPTSKLSATIKNSIPCEKVLDGGQSVSDALKVACTSAGSGPLIIAGSLYLAGDVLRLLEEKARPS
jgi:dihydrofolate synthase